MKEERRSESIKQRLHNIAIANREEHQLVLMRYVMERFLYRVGVSSYRDNFILKGANVFQVWTGKPHRATRDLDALLLRLSLADIRQAIERISGIECHEDGIEFDHDSIMVSEIKKGSDEPGVRVKLNAKLGTSQIPLQIDIAIGDTPFPSPQELEVPTLLKRDRISLLSYPPEAVVSEKLQTIMALGMANSRLKDYYDIWYILKSFSLSEENLSTAISMTCSNRKTTIDGEVPLGLTELFSKDQDKVRQWVTFLKRADIEPLELSEIVDEIVQKLLTPIKLASQMADKA